VSKANASRDEDIEVLHIRLVEDVAPSVVPFQSKTGDQKVLSPRDFSIGMDGKENAADRVGSVLYLTEFELRRAVAPTQDPTHPAGYISRVGRSQQIKLTSKGSIRKRAVYVVNCHEEIKKGNWGSPKNI